MSWGGLAVAAEAVHRAEVPEDVDSEFAVDLEDTGPVNLTVGWALYRRADGAVALVAAWAEYQLDKYWVSVLG